MRALMIPPEIRLVTNFAHRSRALYYHLRIWMIFAEMYHNIRVIFADVFIRLFEEMTKTKNPKAVKALKFYRSKNVLIKNLFGKIIQAAIRSAIDRLCKETKLTQKRLVKDNRHLYKTIIIKKKKTKKYNF